MNYIKIMNSVRRGIFRIGQLSGTKGFKIHVRCISVVPDNAYAEKIINTIFRYSIGDSVPYWPLSNAKQLAFEYIHDDRFSSDKERVNELIVTESFGAGFVTEAGGVIALPIGFPAALMSAWILQARLAGTIAEIYGYDTNLALNRTRILLSMVNYPEMLKQVENSLNNEKERATDSLLENDDINILVNDGTTVKSEKMDEHLYKKAGHEIGLSRLPIGGYAFLQNVVAKHLARNIGTRAGVTSTGRALPIVGGFVAGGVDTYSINKVGTNAKDIFEKALKQQ